MRCPIDDNELVMAERQGIEIDYCPKCRGVWLDRGELDKIIDRAAAEAQPYGPAAGETMPHYGEESDGDRFRVDDDFGHGRKDYRPRRRKTFWGELFDFD